MKEKREKKNSSKQKPLSLLGPTPLLFFAPGIGANALCASLPLAAVAHQICVITAAALRPACTGRSCHNGQNFCPDCDAKAAWAVLDWAGGQSKQPGRAGPAEKSV